MPKPPNHDTSGLDIPPESTLLRAEYERSGLTIAAMSRATGISTAALHIAMNGFRYREGGTPTSVTPPDKTIVKLASLLRISPGILREVKRERAAQLLEETPAHQRPTSTPSDRDAQFAAASRRLLVRQMLAVFNTEELRAEIELRNEAEAIDSDDSEFHAELAEDLNTDQWPQ